MHANLDKKADAVRHGIGPSIALPGLTLGSRDVFIIAMVPSKMGLKMGLIMMFFIVG